MFSAWGTRHECYMDKKETARQTSSGAVVGIGAGTATVVVETAVVVEIAVLVETPTLVVGTLVVTVTITVVDRLSVSVSDGGLSPSSLRPLFNLCCAPANKPMKTELRSKKSRTSTSRIFVRGDNGSCTADDNRSVNVCSWGCLRVSSGEDTLWRRGAVSGSDLWVSTMSSRYRYAWYCTFVS